ncbi:MAG: aspartate/glutamate racemase family protein [Pseudomonadota bacterium]
MIVQGGRTVFGAEIGILMLETRFPRIPGDIGNARTWPFPVRYRVVRGASPDRVVRQRADGLLDTFIEAGRELVADGVRIITTSCGFLTLFQEELATALDVPVATSALLQAAAIQRMLPAGRQVGILTIDAAALSEGHLAAAWVPDGTPVSGLAPGCELQRVILGDEPELDVAAAEADMVAAATRFQAEHSSLGALLFECTNMPPYKRAVMAATGLPVFSIETLLHQMVQSLPD